MLQDNISKKILVIGAKGFIGSHFYDHYKLTDRNPIATHYREERGFYHLDLAKPSLDHLPLSQGNYAYAIISASIANPKLCNETISYTYQCNTEGTLQLAKQLCKLNITPIIFSTSYVFDGKTGNYPENAEVNPLNEYGLQYAEVEKRLPEVCGENYIIIRLSKVYGTDKGDGTLLDEIANALIHQQIVRAASDQMHSLIHIGDVIRGVIRLQDKNFRGLIQFAGKDVVSRFDIATKMAKVLGVDPQLVQKISLSELKDSFVKPLRIDMNCEQFMLQTGIEPISIDASIEKLVKQYLAAV